MHSIITQWVHNEPVLCVDEAYVRMDWLIRQGGLQLGDNDGEAHDLCSKRLGLFHACDSSLADSGPVEFVLVEERS